ncbi:hypothetical protein [Altererythrobacter sp. MF3-039]|uniref:hypothetical protein n=1 Tax=Altererythrobacter sp. MF3-039 TaxID=3252901 RepID=UPI00390C88A4
MSNDPAAGRFLMISLARFGGAMMAIFGIIVTAGNTEFPVWLGYLLAVLGLATFFLLPRTLARRWRSPPE